MWNTREKTSNVEYIYKNMTYIPYLFRRNRDLGTISVYVGYHDVRCLAAYMYIYGKYIYYVR